MFLREAKEGLRFYRPAGLYHAGDVNEDYRRQYRRNGEVRRIPYTPMLQHVDADHAEADGCLDGGENELSLGQHAQLATEVEHSRHGEHDEQQGQVGVQAIAVQSGEQQAEEQQGRRQQADAVPFPVAEGVFFEVLLVFILDFVAKAVFLVRHNE